MSDSNERAIAVTKRYCPSALAAVVMAVATLVACGPATSAGTSTAAQAPTLSPPPFATPGPTGTPLAEATLSLPNHAMNDGFRVYGWAVYPVPDGATPAMSASAAESVVTSHFPGSPVHSSTLALFLDYGHKRPPILAWVIDVTPSGPVSGQGMGGPPGANTSFPPITYTWFATVVDAQRSDSEYGQVVGYAGSTEP